MSVFKLSPAVDANKVFLIQKSDLLSRWDTTAYKSYFRFTSKKFPIEKLRKVAFINPKVTFSKLKNGDSVSFIPMEVVDEINGVIKETRLKPVLETKGFTRFEENDLIWAKITPCMQNGKSAVVRNLNYGLGCGSTEFFVLRPKNTGLLLVDYLYILLRDERILGVAQNFFGGSAGQQRVSIDFLLNLDIPLPPVVLQQDIVAIYTDALRQKQQKEQQATELLATIDGYLLGELGITLPQQDNSLEKRMFRVSSREVSGGRLDADFYKGFYAQSLKQLFTTHNVKTLNDISFGIFQGVGKNEVAYSDFQLLKVKNIKQNNHIDFSDTEYVADVPLNKVLQPNDIISPFIGEAIKQYKFANFNSKLGKYAVDNNTGVIRIDSSLCNPVYVCEFLNSVLTKFQIDRQLGGGGVPFLGANGAKKIVIPVITMVKQIEIVTHIQSIRTQAAQLQTEAAQVLADAKAQVERMILGEG